MGCTTSKAIDFDQISAVNSALANGRSAMMEAKIALRQRYNKQRRELDQLIQQREYTVKLIDQLKALDPKKITNKVAVDTHIAHLTRILANADEVIAFSEKELGAQQAVINKLPMTW